MGVFNVLFYIWLAKTPSFESYLHFNAEICARLLGWLGEQATAEGTTIRSPRFPLEIRHGCDAIQPSAFFVFAMLATPAPPVLVAKIPAILAGTAVLLLLNLVRILTLYYTGVHYRALFDTMHIDVWQALFVFFPLFLWVMWARRAMGRRVAPAEPHA